MGTMGLSALLARSATEGSILMAVINATTGDGMLFE